MSDKVMAELAAQNAIRRLISLYCDAVGRRDPDAIAGLFAPDARVVIADGPERVGRDEIVAGLQRTVFGFDFLHQRCDTGLIDVADDRARARIGVMEMNRVVGAETLNLIFGVYEDEYGRDSEGWRFRTRRFTMRFRAMLPAEQLQEYPAFPPMFDLAP